MGCRTHKWAFTFKNRLRECWKCQNSRSWAIPTTEPHSFFPRHHVCDLITLLPLKAETRHGAYPSDFVCCVTSGTQLSKWQRGGETDRREEDIARWLLFTQLFEQVNGKSRICQSQGIHCGPRTKNKSEVISKSPLKCSQLHFANAIRILVKQTRGLG